MRKNIQEGTKYNLHKTPPKNSNIVSIIACLKRRYHLHIFFKGCLPQMLMVPFLNNLSLARFSPRFIKNYVRTAVSAISAVSNSFIGMSAFSLGQVKSSAIFLAWNGINLVSFAGTLKHQLNDCPRNVFLPVFLLNKLLCRLISCEIYYLRFIS